jgi:hypothetical protein
MPRGLWPGARSDGSHHRYPGCESDRKRGASIDPVGYDAGKKTKGIKRNAIIDTEGHLLAIEVIAANTQDRDCAADLIKQALRKYPRLRKLFADGGYAGPKLASLSKSRSSNAPTRTAASSSFADAGSLSARSPGCAATAA